METTATDLGTVTLALDVIVARVKDLRQVQTHGWFPCAVRLNAALTDMPRDMFEGLALADARVQRGYYVDGAPNGRARYCATVEHEGERIVIESEWFDAKEAA